MLSVQSLSAASTACRNGYALTYSQSKRVALEDGVGARVRHPVSSQRSVFSLADRAKIAGSVHESLAHDRRSTALARVPREPMDTQMRPVRTRLPTIDTLKNWEPLKVAFPLVRGYFTVGRRVKDAHCLHTRVRPHDFNMSTARSKEESGIRDRVHRMPPPTKMGTASATTQSRPPLLFFSWRPVRAGGP